MIVGVGMSNFSGGFSGGFGSGFGRGLGRVLGRGVWAVGVGFCPDDEVGDPEPPSSPDVDVESAPPDLLFGLDLVRG
ncbi:hypothetical protein GCM10009555_023470 [Acrocarpospora macrocephala]|uniref:Uncharacterized protein n=1 Tax=Acrocarpospora macrocephala TaxID=150177 RepID=A0A5M3WWF8_9ACTN|nr:hypothetical protein Amac_058760 [Acrocarpospora macrocephala]